jgi:hypothetical protein
MKIDDYSFIAVQIEMNILLIGWLTIVFRAMYV